MCGSDTMETNRRVKMTKRLIKEAFISLIEKSPLNKITVKQICENADVNRSTFYAHYSDQYELFDEIQEDIINITPKVSLYEKGPILKNLTSFFEFINDNKRIYKVIFENTAGMYFRNRGLNKLFNRDDKSINWVKNEVELKNTMHFKMLMCAFGGITMVEKWIFGEFEASPEELAVYMARFIEKA